MVNWQKIGAVILLTLALKTWGGDLPNIFVHADHFIQVIVVHGSSK
ncbi:hypothetical protein [Nissabacter sp. SGAir0207]|nr:hypothetical protein [Nissabacter sp. SGAir0207]